MKVLNLYAGIGGNRKLWPQECEVTAVELNPKIAGIYSFFFPQDVVIITDAHKYLIDHYQEFDFIWSSPPCQSHSRTNIFLNAQGHKRYPDLGLYEEVLYLQRFCKYKWVVENVRPYYEPIVPAQGVGRHLFWANFKIDHKDVFPTFSTLNCKADSRMKREEYYQKLQEYLDIYIPYDVYTNHDKFSLLTNCVHPKLGLHVFNCAFKYKQMGLV